MSQHEEINEKYGIEKPRNLEPVNPSKPKIPTVLILDTSKSMAPYADKVIEAFYRLIREISEDIMLQTSLELCVVTYDDEPHVRSEFKRFSTDIKLPEDLDFDGTTATHKTMELAIDLINERRKQYAERDIDSYKPAIYLITDGNANDDGDYSRIRRYQNDGGWNVLPIAIGNDITPAKMAEIRPDGMYFHIEERGELSAAFRLIKDSFSSLTRNLPVPIPENVQVIQLNNGIDKASEIVA